MNDPTTASHEVRLTRTPAPAPPGWFDIRADIAARVLSGSGVEIGGLHYPVAVPSGVEVRYVDRMSVDELREHYPELNHLDLVEVDIVDDGERLDAIEQGSLDFIIANHFLEHCHDPIATIENHLRKLASGGVLFYAVPDKRFTFDVDRDVTSLEHMILDHEEGPERSRAQHFDEWARYVYEDPDEPVRKEEQIRELAQELDEQDYSIHTHVFTQTEILNLVLHCRERFENAFDIEVAWRRSLELILVLRKAGPVPPPAGFQVQDLAPHPVPSRPSQAATERIETRARAAVAWLRSRAGELRAARHRLVRHDPDAISRVLVPVSALRPSLDGGWPEDAAWRPKVVVGGVGRDALEFGSDRPVAFTLRLPPGSRLRSSVALAPDGSDTQATSATFSVGLRSITGQILGSWTKTLPADSRGWVDFTPPLVAASVAEAQYVALWLTVSGRQPDGSATPIRGVWGDLSIEIPAVSVPELPKAPIPLTRGHRVSTRRSPQDAREQPLISVLMPIHDPDPEFLENAIASVRRQTYTNWQLCLADDASAEARVRMILARHVGEDGRIELTRHERARGISGATNAALALAKGEFVALVDHDDVIADDALEAFAQVLADDPMLDMIYSDEDRISADGTEHSSTFFKPDWSPELLRTAMYTCHLGVYRRSLVVDLGGFRSEFDGSQDYDLVLRLIERTDRIGHIPRVLYSWRIHPRSAASGEKGKPDAWGAARRAIEEHLTRTGVSATAEMGPHLGWYRVHYKGGANASAAVLVPVATPPRSPEEVRAFADCVRSWPLGGQAGVEVFLAGSADSLQSCLQPLSDLDVDAGPLRFCVFEGAGSSAALVSAAALEADSELLILWPGPLKVKTPDWLEQLLGVALQPEIGVAAGTVRSANGNVDRGAVVFGGGWPLQVMSGQSGLAFPALMANFRAVCGAVALRRDVFATLGGLDSELGDLAAVDLSLRAGQRGLRSVLCSEVEFAWPSGAYGDPNDPALLVGFRERWRSLGEDPYYSPNFWQGRGDFVVSSP